MTIFYKGTAVRISSVQGDSGNELLSVINAERPAIDLDMTHGLSAADLTADGGEREIAAEIGHVRRLSDQIMDDLRVEIADYYVQKATGQRDILAFLAAFPDREIWVDEEARLEASEYDHDAVLASSIDDHDEGAEYHVDQDLTLPFLEDIGVYLKVENFQTDPVGPDDYIFEAFGRSFLVSLNWRDAHGNDVSFDSSKAVRAFVRLEPDDGWDEENDDDPLTMVRTHGRNYRFANATAPA